MRRAEVILAVSINVERVELAKDGSTTRFITGRVRLSYRAPLLPLLTIGMTIGSSGQGGCRPWDGFRVDAINADVDTGQVMAGMQIAAQTEAAVAPLVQEWLSKGFRVVA